MPFLRLMNSWTRFFVDLNVFRWEKSNRLFRTVLSPPPLPPSPLPFALNRPFRLVTASIQITDDISHINISSNSMTFWLVARDHAHKCMGRKAVVLKAATSSAVAAAVATATVEHEQRHLLIYPSWPNPTNKNERTHMHGAHINTDASVHTPIRTHTHSRTQCERV